MITCRKTRHKIEHEVWDEKKNHKKKDKQRNKETKTKATKIVYLQAAKNIPLW